MQNTEVRIGAIDDFLQLATLDYSNSVENMFEVVKKDGYLSLQEIVLPEPILNASSNYAEEIEQEMIHKLSDINCIPLVVFVDHVPAGYLMAKWGQWPEGKVVEIEGILVAHQYAGKGLAKAMLMEIMKIAKADAECRGIYAEMDTIKYQANKLLMNMGFVFAGTKLFVYSNKDPRAGSKEAVYFFYKIEK
ncbi:MAG: GNAT family N-acetyltransferase [Candidatus Peribacteraceae bacterium]|nr:GNAT family N-acetyltransferase [Candidatus Peribacteraceae bacterium]